MGSISDHRDEYLNIGQREKEKLAAVTEDMELFRDRAKRWNIKCQDDAKEITRLRGLLGEIEALQLTGRLLNDILDRFNEGGE
jgi:hypothetical protein